MSKSLFLCAALLCASAASAGVRVESVTRDIKTQVVDGGTQVVMVQDGNVRVINSKETGGVILKGSMLYVMDDKGKTYSEIDKATMKKTADLAGAQIKKLQEQLKNLPPEQRAQMEKMMGSHMSGMASLETVTYEAKDTGKSDSSEGRKCRVWNLLKNGVVHEELCVVPFASLPGKEDFEKTFKELADAFAGMAVNLPGVGESIKARKAIEGYPVRVRSFDEAGKPRSTETVMTKWIEEALPGATFEVPADYKKKELPKMMGG